MPFLLDGYSFDETQLPNDVQGFLSNEKPSEAKFDFSDKTYALVGVDQSRDFAEQKEQKLEHKAGEGEREEKLNLIEILAGLGKTEHLKMILANEAAEKTITANGNRALSLAAGNGHLPTVEHLLTYEAVEQDIFAHHRRNALYSAVENGHIEVVRYLSRYPKVMEEIVDTDHSMVAVAAGKGHVQMIKYLLGYEHVKVAIVGHCFKAFCAAAEFGRLNAVQYLVELNNFKVMKGHITGLHNYALYWAAAHGHRSVVAYLLTYNEVNEYIARAGKSAAILSQAALYGQLEMVKYLLTYKAIAQDLRGDDYSTLRAAVHNNHTEIVNHLLTYAVVFSYAEMHEHEYGNYTHPFIVNELTALRLAKASEEKNRNEEKHPNAIFDVRDAEKAQLCFYMVRNLIRRNSPDLLNDDIRFLLSIPAVNNLAKQNDNELLRLAIAQNNRDVMRGLLAIPAVYQLAYDRNFYAEEAQGRINLREIAENKESSMRALSPAEQIRLEDATRRYDPLIAKAGGVDVVFEKLRATIEARYANKPAFIVVKEKDEKNEVKDKTIFLPLSWTDFEALGLKDEVRAKALEAYYKHVDHNAYRYLSKPNHWMHPRAAYVNVNPHNPNERWSAFEEYKPFLSMLYMAAIDPDPEMEPTEGYTIETRLDGLIDELYQINRAHNWDNHRENAKTKEDEEYDDLEADRPSCYSGEKLRLFQSVRGHPLLNILTKEKIDQEIKAFCQNFVQSKIKELKLEGEQIKALEETCKAFLSDPFLELKEEDKFKSVIVILKGAQDQFLDYLEKRYGKQFDLTLKARILMLFTTRGNFTDDSVEAGAVNALAFGKDKEWLAVFNAAAKTISSSSDTQTMQSLGTMGVFNRTHSSDGAEEKKEIKTETPKGQEPSY